MMGLISSFHLVKEVKPLSVFPGNFDVMCVYNPLCILRFLLATDSSHYLARTGWLAI